MQENILDLFGMSKGRQYEEDMKNFDSLSAEK